MAAVYAMLLTPPAEPGAPGSRGCHPGYEGWEKAIPPSSCLELGLDFSLRSRACGRQDSALEALGLSLGCL